MMTGFLVNNVTLSISMILFCINALWGINPRMWFRNKWWLLGLLWMAFIAVSYFWSEDKGHWERSFQVKMPLLLFPLACGFMPVFSARQLQRITVLIGLILTIGVLYSLSFLLIDYDKYISAYKFSGLLPTPCVGDHVRFSMSLALFIVWCIYIWPWFETALFKRVTAVIMAVLAVYLHILAAKSGLVALYLFLSAWSIYLAFVKKKLVGLIIIFSIPVIIFLAIRFIPTFGERKDYIYYAWTMLKEGDRSGKYGDIGRLMSYKIAFQRISEHPWIGVGAGDMLNEMKRGYDQYYPQVDEKARLLPHNQFLIIGLGCGIPAMLVFIAWVLYPLTWLRRNRKGFFFFVVWLLLLTQLLIEPVLEVQFGVFLYMFFLLWQGQEMPELQNTGNNKAA